MLLSGCGGVLRCSHGPRPVDRSLTAVVSYDAIGRIAVSAAASSSCSRRSGASRVSCKPCPPDSFSLPTYLRNFYFCSTWRAGTRATTGASSTRKPGLRKVPLKLGSSSYMGKPGFFDSIRLYCVRPDSNKIQRPHQHLRKLLPVPCKQRYRGVQL
jgi:hypothetical protein